MGGDEIDRELVRFGIGDEFGNPCDACGSRTANFQRGVYTPYGLHRFPVETEIGLLVGIDPEPVEIWLIPHFEAPAFDLFPAEIGFQILDECRDEVGPFLPVLGRRHIASPVEDSGVLRRQILGHEAYFDHRLETGLQHLAVHLVDPVEIIIGPSVNLAISIRIFGKNAVEADIFEASLVMHQAHLVLIFLAQQQPCMTRAHAIPPYRAHRPGNRLHVGRNCACALCRRLRGR